MSSFLIMDVGSNAVKASLVRDKNIVRDWRETTQIGRDRGTDGAISGDGIERLCGAMARILEDMAGVSRWALGTEALRRAPNVSDVRWIVRDRFDLELEVISAEREAELERKAVGASRAMREHVGQCVLMMDSGGSSTEASFVDECGRLLASKSWPFGQHLMKEALESGCRFPHLEMFRELRGWFDVKKPDIVVAAGSSLTTYASHYLKKKAFNSGDVESIRVAYRPELVPERSDVKAAQVGQKLIEALGELTLAPVYVTTLGIRHGWLAENNLI